MIRLLILAPDEIQRAGFTAALSHEDDIELVGFTINPVETRSEFNRLKPQAILLDDCVDGDLIQAAEDAGINTIVFSSNSEHADILQALSAGAKAYVLKGASISLLVSAIKAVESGATWLDPGIAKQTLQGMTDGREVSAPSKDNRRANSNLSPRETQVLALLCEGLANSGIANNLFLSQETVKTHVSNIMQKLQVNSRTAAAIHGIKLGLCI